MTGTLEACRSTTKAPVFGRGFSLIELLVVVVIIAVLLGIGLVVGSAVTGAGQKLATQSRIVILDQSLEAYMADRGSIPPAIVKVSDPEETNPSQFRYMHLADAATFGQTASSRDALPEMVNSLGAYIKATDAVAGLKPILSTLSPPPEVYKPRESTQPALLTVFDSFRTTLTVDSAVSTPIESLDDVLASRVNDNFNNPIRFVHPSFDGTFVRGEERTRGRAGPALEVVFQDRYTFSGTALPAIHGSSPNSGFNSLFVSRSLRRNFLTDEDRANWREESLPIGDSDGGQCPGGVPYFYSPGPDGDPSTLDDNVYSITPVLPTES